MTSDDGGALGMFMKVMTTIMIMTTGMVVISDVNDDNDNNDDELCDFMMMTMTVDRIMMMTNIYNYNNNRITKMILV